MVDEQGSQDIVVVLGAAEAVYVEMMAETVTAGDPTYTGPLSGVSLGLPVFHVTEPEVKAASDAAIYKDQIELAEISMDTDEIWTSVRGVRERNLPS